MSQKTLLLFDVDGTLTIPRQQAKQEMLDVIEAVRAAGFVVGIVGGSDLKKQEEQLGADLLARFDYVFSENGLLGFKEGKEIHRQNFVKFLGDDRLKPFLKKTLRLIADADIPVQRGTFIELRNGMLNISPIGRNCSQSERDDFEKFDHEHKIRAGIIRELQTAFPDYGLKYSIGGQISFDVFPIGWDKTYCLQFVENDFGDIHFFGDKTSEGGNDFEIFTHERTIGHSVKTYHDTIAILKELLSE
jgi:phosphomannomutase